MFSCVKIREIYVAFFIFIDALQTIYISERRLKLFDYAFLFYI
jgi:hypothetical protein